MIKCCIYTRIYNDSPYLNFFLEHYIRLGFTKIIILKCDKIKYNISNAFRNFIEVYSIENLPKEEELPQNSYLIKNTNYDWVLQVDSDEILLLNNKFKSIQDYIAFQLNKNNNINCFYFRQGWIQKVDNSNSVSFSDIIRNYNIYSHMLIKSMVKVSNLDFAMNSHIFKLNKSLCVYFEDNISNRYQTHHEINKNQYSETILLHIGDKSINNIIIKCLNTNIIEEWKNKNCGNNNQIVELNNLINKTFNENTLNNFKNINKRILHSYSIANRNTIELKNFLIKKYLYPVIDVAKEKRLLDISLQKNNINLEKYYKFAEYISDEILNRKDFIKN
jgi:hypothetical protein